MKHSVRSGVEGSKPTADLFRAFGAEGMMPAPFREMAGVVHRTDNERICRLDVRLGPSARPPSRMVEER